MSLQWSVIIFIRLFPDKFVLLKKLISLFCQSITFLKSINVQRNQHVLFEWKKIQLFVWI